MTLGLRRVEMGVHDVFKITAYRGICNTDPKEVTEYLLTRAKDEYRIEPDGLSVKYQDFSIDLHTSPKILTDTAEDILQQFQHFTGCISYVKSAWTIIHEREHQTYPHTHINSKEDYAVVYWAQAKKGSGLLELYPTGISGEAVYVEPVEGQFLIFPGSMLHGVRQNLSNDLRVSLSMNIAFDTLEPLTEKDKEIAESYVNIDYDHYS